MLVFEKMEKQGEGENGQRKTSQRGGPENSERGGEGGAAIKILFILV